MAFTPEEVRVSNNTNNLIDRSAQANSYFRNGIGQSLIGGDIYPYTYYYKNTFFNRDITVPLIYPLKVYKNSSHSVLDDLDDWNRYDYSSSLEYTTGGYTWNPGWIVPGYKPSFQKKLCKLSNCAYLIIKRTSSALTITRYQSDGNPSTMGGDAVLSFSSSDFPDRAIPHRLIVALQGGGGGGGSSLWAMAGTGGTGGAGGAFIVGVIDLDTYSEWKATIGFGGSGGSGNSAPGKAGGDAVLEPVASSPSILCTVRAGGGGRGNGGASTGVAQGGQASVTQYYGTVFWELTSINGGNGGARTHGDKGADVGEWEVYDSEITRPSEFENITYITSGTHKGGSGNAGGGTAGGGGASANGDGGDSIAAGMGDSGGPGAGGAGGSYNAIFTPEGGSGGDGFVAIYY